MRTRILAGFLCTVLVLAIVPSLAANETSLPLVIRRGFTIVVRGSVGGIKNLNFVIDTGAVPSVVDTRLSHRLGLTGQPDQVSVFTHSVPAERVVLPDVIVGPIHVTRLEALVQDLTFIERGLGERVDALIGLDVLGKMNFSIDYASQRLIFDPVLEGQTVWSELEAGNSYVATQIQLQGVPLRLMVDTGVKHVVLFENRVQSLLPVDRIQGARITSNLGGTAQLKRIEAPSAMIGLTHLTMGNVFLLATPTDLSLGIDGLLGVAALKPVRVDFNFARRAIGWRW